MDGSETSGYNSKKLEVFQYSPVVRLTLEELNDISNCKIKNIPKKIRNKHRIIRNENVHTNMYKIKKKYVNVYEITISCELTNLREFNTKADAQLSGNLIKQGYILCF